MTQKRIPKTIRYAAAFLLLVMFSVGVWRFPAGLRVAARQLCFYFCQFVRTFPEFDFQVLWKPNGRYFSSRGLTFQHKYAKF